MTNARTGAVFDGGSELRSPAAMPISINGNGLAVCLSRTYTPLRDVFGGPAWTICMWLRPHARSIGANAIEGKELPK